MPAGPVALTAPDRPCSAISTSQVGQVASVDDGDRLSQGVRDDHPPAAGDPVQPPAEAVDRVVGADDQAGPRGEEPVAERGAQHPLGVGLVRPVLVVVRRPGRLVVLGPDRARRPVAVGVQAADEGIAPDVAQRRGGVAGGGPGLAGGVDDEVGRPAVEGGGEGRGVVAVAVQRAGTLGRRAGDAAGEGRDLVAPLQRRRRDVPAEEVRAAEDEESHALTPAEPLPRRPAGSRRGGTTLRSDRRGGRAAPAPAAAGSSGPRPAPSAASAAGPRRVHSRSARAPVSTSVSGGTTSRSARRRPPSQVRQTTPGSMLRNPPVRTVRPPTTILRATGDHASRA